jgi:competence CoiA-like predicted nuclease
MLYANSPDNQKIVATPNAKGTCPYCQGAVIPKCGPINIDHWAHKSLEQCDTWYQPETDWHLNWKSNFSKDNTEVILSMFGKKHVADYFDPISKTTVEFQNSPMSLNERFERESFYPNLIWIYNVENKSGLHQLNKTDDSSSLIKYKWVHAKKWMIYGLNRACFYFIDNLPNDEHIFQITNVNINKTAERNDFGWRVIKNTVITGIPWEREYFIYRMNKNIGWW